MCGRWVVAWVKGLGERVMGERIMDGWVWIYWCLLVAGWVYKWKEGWVVWLGVCTDGRKGDCGGWVGVQMEGSVGCGGCTDGRKGGLWWVYRWKEGPVSES